MAIKEELTEGDFIRAFDDYNRSENFSIKGRRALYNYLEDLSEDTGQDITLDVIALCCEYDEYEDIEDYFNNYYAEEQKLEIINQFIEDNNLNEDEINDLYELDEFKTFIEEKLSEETFLLKFEDDINEGFIIQSY